MVGGATMPTAKSFRRQAATCAALAAQIADEESRQRYKRLEQMYLHLAETEEPLANQAETFPGDTKAEPATYRT
jgi:hypothetical protein